MSRSSVSDAAVVPSAPIDDERARAGVQHQPRARRAASCQPSTQRCRPRRSRAPARARASRLQREPLQTAVGADEPRDELVGGVREELLGSVVLDEHAALAEDRDPVAEQDRLVDVVGDEDDRLAHLALDADELLLEPHARDRIERAERLVHQHHGRVGGEGAREADALALAAGELRGVARAIVARGEVDEVEQLVDALADLAACPTRAAAGRCRRCPRRSCAERGRPAGSRSRCRAAARSRPALGCCGRRSARRPRSARRGG